MGMVTKSSITEAQAFAQRLRQALQDAGVSPSPTVVAHEFNLRYWGKSITVHAARNWLLGQSMPKQDKLRVLATWLQVSPEVLLLGGGSDGKKRGEVEESLSNLLHNLNMADEEMMRNYLNLSRENRVNVRSVVAAFRALDACQPLRRDGN
jgi:hypothetical protein